VAGRIWPDVGERRALGNLRTALWRLGRVHRVVETIDERLQLDESVRVDVADLSALSLALIAEPSDESLRSVPRLAAAGDLLPDWDEEWLIVERERFHELRIRALEQACCALLDQRRPGDALLAALAAVSAEPLRESAQRALVRVHLEDGNLSSALRCYESYRQLMWTELELRTPATVYEFVGST
jgi:DNA-binding SARP family transcriptional activator